MVEIREVISAGLLVIGALFMLLAGVGIVRLPDLFTRMQASTKAATLGVGCMFVAVIIYFADIAITARAILIIAFVLLTASVAAHVIARAAYAIGVPLWEGTITDELREHFSQRFEEPESAEDADILSEEKDDKVKE